jgi:hypothetical protein
MAKEIAIGHRSSVRRGEDGAFHKGLKMEQTAHRQCQGTGHVRRERQWGQSHGIASTFLQDTLSQLGRNCYVLSTKEVPKTQEMTQGAEGPEGPKTSVALTQSPAWAKGCQGRKEQNHIGEDSGRHGGPKAFLI